MSDYNMATVSVSGTTYPDDAQAQFGFYADSTLLLNRSSTAADVVYFSFDGTNDHGLLIPGTIPAVEWRAKRKQVWLRLDSGASTTSVNVMAHTAV
jgi:hypothetical protein